eukprot:TRINITY_DN2743_c0_g1_i2.p1 TRINITY_DN2743_c0_g1~~TRINITY_DN2743_c0_g1_i2.p1  ORF type:complete len:406 (-),score=79.34 TRINITY_DN2743_c0_g1_i2:149-1366(-)
MRTVTAKKQPGTSTTDSAISPPSPGSTTTEVITHINNYNKEGDGKNSKQQQQSTAPYNDKNNGADILNSKQRVGELQDFLWSMSDEPHASRRKSMISEHSKVLQPLFGYEWKTKYIVCTLMAVQLAMAFWLGNEVGSLRFFLCAYVVGATITQSLFLAEHEISHNLAFRSFMHNKLFGIFANIPLVFPYFISFKFYHNEHHKHQGVVGIDTDIPTPFEARLLGGNFVGKLFFIMNQLLFYALRPVFVKAQPLTWWHALNAGVQAAFAGLTFYFAGIGPLLYLCLCMWFSGGLHPMASHFIAEHYVFSTHNGKEENEAGAPVETASYYGWMNWLTFNVGYHNEHHDFPNIPWSRLPALERIGQYKETLPHHESWVMVLVEFIRNPKVSLFNRVTRGQPTVPATSSM